MNSRPEHAAAADHVPQTPSGVQAARAWERWVAAHEDSRTIEVEGKLVPRR